ncbi:hypothetical protein TCAL_07113 [Tigriopus californicus]|uniref:VHS domain-containing protein n=1 Tax=Tigriopus californicus TaxID=6832 RepID=A0A553PAU2_TIGCA|nr:ADP-ribosylation factor-binding protein GGA1-like [Tigriopus californicus]TRY74797.1 hypothetical protein TCAL_07113 [Tigriopus californicus]|eukprot:TCALIF_07113-PA protein Name:"Similar to Gga1 ADP-ribosylation factor-binding protein GGA1 (Mus musculus)" AED:0.00 eAED:0.00 QI:0/-1/0/1/-1/1/1/0/647
MTSEALESLLFKATNPSNKIEDVNTIKKFCDTVRNTKEGPSIACKLIAHKIQSPQEREAIQTLAVLEACVKSCGEAFHIEVGKFKFLNEMIKLVSPRYLAGRTPDHIKKKIIELLFLWTKDLGNEGKIKEAYEMLKKQGIVTEDPIYVGGAVFASSLPPRPDAPLTQAQTQELKKLLQSKNPEDLEKANTIIKGMVKEDERKMDQLTRRSTELIMVNNNSKLLNEMLDHFEKARSTPQELELLKDLQESCEKMQPKLFRLASDTDEDDETINEILQASDELSKVLDRYRMVIVQGKPDIIKRQGYLSEGRSSNPGNSNSDALLDLGPIPSESKPSSHSIVDDDILGLESAFQASSSPKTTPVQIKTIAPSIDDLLNGSPPLDSGEPSLIMGSNSSSSASLSSKANPLDPFAQKMEAKKASRQRGLEALDLLGETALKSHLTSRSPQFEKRCEKVPMSKMIDHRRELDLTASLTEPVAPSSRSPVTDSPTTVDIPKPPEIQVQKPKEEPPFKLSDLEVAISSIKPRKSPPITLQDSEDGISILLNFGQDQPREHVTAIVVTIINKSPEAITDLEFKAVVPKGCKVKLQTASGQSLPAHNPFVPPSAITQVMLVANPKQISPVSFKYVLSYNQDDDPQTELGEIKSLPL